MSTEWGGLAKDLATRDVAAGPSEPTRPDRDTEAGAWPEEMDEIRFYAASSMTLPGMGSEGQNCGQWYPEEFCDECGDLFFGESHCEQRECPTCGNTMWRRRRSERITRRLGAARYAADPGKDKRALHAIFSAPVGEIRSIDDVHQGFRHVYDLAREKGIRGGTVIFHGFRVTDEAKALFEAAKAAGKWDEDVDGRLWAFVRRQEARIDRGIGGGDWRELTYWSPHWHVLGMARDFEADDPDAQEGWVARRIRSLESFTLHGDDGYEDMVRTAMYLLSHATFEADSSQKAIRWFGDLHPSSFSPEEDLSNDALEVIERKAREVAKTGPGRGDGTPENDECEECGSTSRSPIWDAGKALMDPGWCDRIGREKERRLRIAWEWRIGDVDPPPGLRNPRTEEEAREAFEALV